MNARRFRPLSFPLLLLLTVVGSPTQAQSPADEEQARRATAVALNYSRASFHRIQRYGSKRVMLEEQEKILNNLNLNGIEDQEVVKLYSGVLQEISAVEIAEKEREVLQDKYNKTLQRQIGSSLFIMSAQLATISLDALVRTGVNSWLDYRDLHWTREFDVWKVEKSRIQAVTSKSNQYLDTCWKMARDKNIPDQWLIRGNDLDELEKHVREPNLEKRLRLLKRMEPYMECYPPYWYYVARTQQGTGDLYAAAETYGRLARLGEGHFRRDDMLAASLANRAMILAHLKLPGARQAAMRALRHSSAVWEANLMCAQVLEGHGEIDEAEDAILRNLDADLEKPRSAVALVGLYYRQNDLDRLANVLASPDMLASIPILSMVQCMERLGPERTPPAVVQRVRNSLRVAVERRFIGRDDLIVSCGPSWQPGNAEIQLQLVGENSPVWKGTERAVHPTGSHIVRFRGVVDAGSQFGQKGIDLSGAVLTLKYRAGKKPLPPMRVTLGKPLRKYGGATAPWWTAASPVEFHYGRLQLSLLGAEKGFLAKKLPAETGGVHDSLPRSRSDGVPNLPRDAVHESDDDEFRIRIPDRGTNQTPLKIPLPGSEESRKVESREEQGTDPSKNVTTEVPRKRLKRIPRARIVGVSPVYEDSKSPAGQESADGLDSGSDRPVPTPPLEND